MIDTKGIDYSSIVYKKQDKSFIIHKNKLPYHVPYDSPDYKDLWDHLYEFTKNNPDIVSEEFILPLEEMKNNKKLDINSRTKSIIYGGFIYNINGTDFKFNYNSDDQQNYSDDANMILFQKANGLPLSNINRTGYSIPDNTPISLSFNGDAFLDLYYNGALAHKNRVLKEGKERKLRIEKASTKEELDAI